jgi:PAS domain S-box-containing protein
MPFGAGLGGKVAETGKGFIVEDYFQEIEPLLHDVVREEGLISACAVPIQMGQNNLGVLYVFHRRKAAFSKSDLDTLSLLGNLAAIEISRKEAEEALRLTLDELEQRVEDRTAELRGVNKKLLLEICERRDAVEAMEEREEMLRSILSTSPIGIAFTREKKLKWVNEAWVKIYGFEHENEYLDQSVDILYPSLKERKRVAKKQYKDLDTGTITQTDAKCRRTDGSVFDAVLRMKAVDPSDLSKGVIAAVSDISERKRAEEKVRQSEEHYRSVMDASLVGIFIVQDQKFTYVNPEMDRLCGYQRGEIQAKANPVDLVVPEHREMALGNLIKRARGEPGYPYEIKALRKDGTIFDAMVWGKGITYRDRPASVGTVIDITDRKRAEKALRESEARYRHLVDNAPLGILSCDTHGNITELNPAVLDLLDSPSAEATKAINLLTFPPLVEAGVSAAFRKCLASGERIVLEHPYTSKWGKQIHARLHVVPILSTDDNIVGAQALLEDISELKRTQELLLQTERLKAVAELASGVAHNFNNLLQIIVGGADLASMHLEMGNYADVKKNLEEIRNSSRFGAGTVNRLQSFARLRSDAFGELKVCDLSDIARQAVEMSKPWWKTEPEREGIKVSLKRELEPGCLVRGRENELFEVAVNLIKNAVEALPEGGSIRVKTSVRKKRALLEVRDSGIGIPQDDLANIFDPFWSTKELEGTGMGLAVSYGIVSRHGGSISAKSKVDRGSVFTVKLPVVKTRPEDETTALGKPFDLTLTILVIDDVQPVLTMIKDGLTAYGQTVLVALSGKDGLETFRKNQVDLVISDLGMPGMNGWEVGRAIRAHCRKRGIPKTPFVLLTGWGGQIRERKKIVESGVDGVVEKPIDIPEMLGTIRNVMETCQGNDGK